jgi:hypothetical protein
MTSITHVLDHSDILAPSPHSGEEKKAKKALPSHTLLFCGGEATSVPVLSSFSVAVYFSLHTGESNSRSSKAHG